jgi:hypothetical protein
MGTGTLDEIRADLVLLEELGAEHVVLDPTIPGEARTQRRQERDLAALETLAKEVVDLATGEIIRA